MAYKSAIDDKLSRYTQGGTTELYPKRLGWWERQLLERKEDDVTYIIDHRSQYRPDLVAYDLYGKATLFWLILQYNNIVDVNEEFISGTQLRLPSPNRVLTSMLNNPVGGIKVK